MGLTSGKRRKIQLELAFMAELRGEALTTDHTGIEPAAAAPDTESPALGASLMEEVCERDNLIMAYKRVKSNRGGPGVDGMTTHELGDYLKEHWPKIREQLLQGIYVPQPVKRVDIPKPGGGVRKLGIPTVVDRFIQQAVLQVLQRRWDGTFSCHSYGFRPGRSAHQAVAQAQSYIREGYEWVVDLDLEKFFDRVNHDHLMGLIASRETDKRLLKLIRAYLTAGVMENGLVGPTDEGAPQGGPLSPLLSNLVLDVLDRELEKRGHRFVRYADDSNIYVKSERAGHRVMTSVKTFLARRLKLQVNESKSAVARPHERKFLGFTFKLWKEPIRLIAPSALKRFKERVRELTGRSRGVSLERMIEELGRYLNGWRSYYGFCQTSDVLRDLDSWVRRRLRSFVWEQWRHKPKRFKELRKLGAKEEWAAKVASSSLGPWRLSQSPGVNAALSNAYFRSLGLPSLVTKRGA